MTSKVEQRDVAVPIVTACVEAKDIPALPGTAMRADADVAALAAGAAVDVKVLRDIARRQRALLLACAVQPEGRK